MGMNALVVGLGSIGKRHLANLRQIAPEIAVTIWHHARPDGAEPPGAEGARRVFHLHEALEPTPDFALITGPASVHVPIALALAEHGIPLLIEKPLSHDREGVDLLLDRCRENGTPLLVAYNFHFHPPLQVMRQALLEGRIGDILYVRAEVGQYLPDWRPGRDYRATPTAQSALGGGVLLELSHEIDYVRWLAGEVRDVTARLDHVSALETDTEDVAELLLGFENGAVGSIHLDMIQRVPTRGCRIAGTTGTLTWDGLTYEVRWYDGAAREWHTLVPAANRDRNEMYVAELRHFLECVQGRATPSVTGEDGLRTLDIVLAARQSASEGRRVAL